MIIFAHRIQVVALLHYWDWTQTKIAKGVFPLNFAFKITIDVLIKILTLFDKFTFPFAIGLFSLWLWDGSFYQIIVVFQVGIDRRCNYTAALFSD